MVFISQMYAQIPIIHTNKLSNRHSGQKMRYIIYFVIQKVSTRYICKHSLLPVCMRACILKDYVLLHSKSMLPKLRQAPKGRLTPEQKLLVHGGVLIFSYLILIHQFDNFWGFALSRGSLIRVSSLAAALMARQ